MKADTIDQITVTKKKNKGIPSNTLQQVLAFSSLVVLVIFSRLRHPVSCNGVILWVFCYLRQL